MVSSALEDSFDIVVLLSGLTAFFQILESEQKKNNFFVCFIVPDDVRGDANAKKSSVLWTWHERVQ